MGEELNTMTTEGAETMAPSFHENIGKMEYEAVLHFAEKGSPTVRDRLRRVILHKANGESDTTNP